MKRRIVTLKLTIQEAEQLLFLAGDMLVDLSELRKGWYRGKPSEFRSAVNAERKLRMAIAEAEARR